MGIVNLTKTVALAAVATLATSAGAATISATSDKVSVGFGEEFTVTLAVDGFSSFSEVDAVDLVVDFDGSLFEYVSHDVSGEFLDEDRINNQQASFSLVDETLYDELADADTVLFSIVDDDLSPSNTRGSAKSSGKLGSITLRAGNTPGIGEVLLSGPPPFGNGGIFFDPEFFEIFEADITGGVSFTNASVEVVPEPASAGVLFVLFGGVWATGLSRARRQIG